MQNTPCGLGLAGVAVGVPAGSPRAASPSAAGEARESRSLADFSFQNKGFTFARPRRSRPFRDPPTRRRAAGGRARPGAASAVPPGDQPPRRSRICSRDRVAAFISRRGLRGRRPSARARTSRRAAASGRGPGCARPGCAPAERFAMRATAARSGSGLASSARSVSRELEAVRARALAGGLRHGQRLVELLQLRGIEVEPGLDRFDTGGRRARRPRPPGRDHPVRRDRRRPRCSRRCRVPARGRRPWSSPPGAHRARVSCESSRSSWILGVSEVERGTTALPRARRAMRGASLRLDAHRRTRFAPRRGPLCNQKLRSGRGVTIRYNFPPPCRAFAAFNRS